MARRIYIHDKKGGLLKKIFLTGILAVSAYYMMNNNLGRKGIDIAKEKIDGVLYENKDICGKLVLNTIKEGEDRCQESIENVLYDNYDKGDMEVSDTVERLYGLDRKTKEKVFRPYGSDKDFVDSRELEFYMNIKDHMRYPSICDKVNRRCYVIKLKDIIGERILQLDPYAMAKERMEEAKSPNRPNKDSSRRYSINLTR